MVGLPERATAAPANLRLAERLYRALAAGDVETLVDLLAEDFEGDLSPGLPNGFGAARITGREAMLIEGWGRISRVVDLAPVLDEVRTSPGEIVARGRYVGRVRANNALLDARFAHFWTVRQGRIGAVFQVTDTGVWRDALQADPAAAG